MVFQKDKFKIRIAHSIQQKKNHVYLDLKCKRELISEIIFGDKKVRKYPTTIQLPITYKCNFDCVMCGMRNLAKQQDFTADELGRILEDKLYSKVISIGINGGEPFLKTDLEQCVEVMLEEISTLKSISIISNGFFTDLICKKLSSIKKMATNKGVKVHLALSVDGIDEMQDFMRGAKDAWKNVNTTIDRLFEKKEQYFDSFKTICTITKHNVYSLYEVEDWAKERDIEVSYNIATINVRIDNEKKLQDFSIFGDEKARMFAAEFFYKRFFNSRSQRDFALFLFITTGERYAACDCQYNRWVTLTPNGRLGYCATHSKDIGNALEQSSYKIFNKNTKYLREIKRDYCRNCSHYMYRLNRIGIKKYFDEIKRIENC
mgnify:CR=1 FL=1